MSPNSSPEPLTAAKSQQTPTKSERSSVKARRSKPIPLGWSNDHNKTYRLLDWLNENQSERDIVFAVAKKGRTETFCKSRKECFTEAAQYIFNSEDEPVFHREISKKPTRITVAVGNRLDSLKRSYQAFNVRIGSRVANLKYEDIEPGSSPHRLIETLSQSFPFWKQLHKNWRILPHYNEFWDGGPRAIPSSDRDIPEGSSGKGTSIRNRAPSKKLLLSNEGEKRHPSRSNLRDTEADREVINIDELPTKEEDEGYSLGSRGRKRIHAEFEKGSSSDQQDADTKGLTSAQKFEQHLAELALKRQKLENEALEKKTSVEIRRLELEAEERRRTAEDNRQREKERHELVMKYMTVVTGISAKENGGEPTGDA